MSEGRPAHRFRVSLSFSRQMNSINCVSGSRTSSTATIFRGKGNCTAGHVGPTFSDERFHNTGIAWRDGRLHDEGRAAVTSLEPDRGAFGRVPARAHRNRGRGLPLRPALMPPERDRSATVCQPRLASGQRASEDSARRHRASSYCACPIKLQCRHGHCRRSACYSPSSTRSRSRTSVTTSAGAFVSNASRRASQSRFLT